MIDNYERPRVKYYLVNRPANPIRTTKRVRRINRWSRHLQLDDDSAKTEEEILQQKSEGLIQDGKVETQIQGKKKGDGMKPAIANSLLASAATVAGAQLAGQALGLGRPPVLIAPVYGNYGHYPGLQTHHPIQPIYPNIQGPNFGSNVGFSPYQNPYLGFSPYQGSNFAAYPNPVLLQPDFGRPRPHHHHRDRQSGLLQFFGF